MTQPARVGDVGAPALSQKKSAAPTPKPDATPCRRQRRPKSWRAASIAAWPSAMHAASAASGRSEEHTSELQSLMRNSYAVFCLKKKKKLKTIHITQAGRHNKQL